MDYLKSGLKGLLGQQEANNAHNNAETVVTLVERIQTCTLLEDRRDACRAIRDLSKKFRVDVGVRSLGALMGILENDRMDAEILKYALETLYNITDPMIIKGEEKFDGTVGEQFTDNLLERKDSVDQILGVLEEYYLHVRLSAVQLLINLLANRLKQVQECILRNPMGVSKLMDLLSDSREVIRNEGFLLLVHLTEGNATIQKIVVFENAFDSIVDVIREAGYSDGEIVVEDCLQLLLTLLKNNSSNQNFFKEGSYIKHLVPFFSQLQLQEGKENGWPGQRVANVHLMLKVVRTLVAPTNPASATAACQKSMFGTNNKDGILQCLCTMLMARGLPDDILIETIKTVADTIRGNSINQDYFATLNAETDLPRPAVVIFLMTMISEVQLIQLRLAVLYCFQCFVFRNPLGQAQLVKTLLPTSIDVDSVTSGHLLCEGLVRSDPVSNWLCSVALLHILVDNACLKEHLLRVQLAKSPDSPSVSLLHQCTVRLTKGGKLQKQIGLLMLLCVWLAGCPPAVSQFLSIPSSVSYLTSQVNSQDGDDGEVLCQGVCAFLLGITALYNDNTAASFTQKIIKKLVISRIGMDRFLEKLSTMSNHESFNVAFKHPQPRQTLPSQLLLDHEFTKLYKALEDLVVAAVSSSEDHMLVPGSPDPSAGPVIEQYKELIREQDEKLETLQQEYSMLQQKCRRVEMSVLEYQEIVDRLQKENAELAAQFSQQGSQNVEANDLRRQLEEMKITNRRLELDLRKRDKSFHEKADEEKQRKRDAYSKQVLQDLKKEQEDLFILLTDQESRIAIYKKQLRAHGHEVEDDDDLEEDCNEDT